MSKKNDNDFFKNLEKKLKKNTNNNGKIPNSPKNKKNNNKWTLLFLIMVSIAFWITFVSLERGEERQESSYSDFYNYTQQGILKSCVVVESQTGNKIEYEIDGIAYYTQIPSNLSTLEVNDLLRDQNIEITFKHHRESQIWLILLQFLPWIIFIGIIFFFLSPMRNMRGGEGGGAFSFSKSKAKLIKPEDIKVSFKDVKGCVEAIEEITDVVHFLQNPKKFIDMGAKIPKGVLLVGSPGTGKTLLAKAVAGESKVPFFFISGSDFVEMFVGVGASRVRDLFNVARKNTPCIIFIDEIDAVGKARGVGFSGGNDEKEQTLNQLLVEMDGFSIREQIVIIAATNRADVLDKALLRPGRFDRQVYVGLPDLKGRKEILKVHLKAVKKDPKLDIESIARSTTGFTGADIANIVNEAAINAVKEKKKAITTADLEFAKDKVILGPERKSMSLAKKEKENTAYHEAGHALVSLMLPDAHDLHKVTIIPRGNALGVTHYLDKKEGVYSVSKKELEAELKVLYGGRVAEEIVFKDVTTGAMNDIERATKIARAMVCDWGLSKLGAVSYFGYKSSINPMYNSGQEGAENSEETYKKIDNEVNTILNEAYLGAKDILKKNISKLKILSKELLEKETLDVDQVYKLLKITKRKTPAT